MTRLRMIAIGVPLLFGWSLAMPQSSELKEVATFPGMYLKWIRVAEDDIHRKHLNLDNYNVFISDHADYVAVYIKSSDAPERSKGSGGAHIGYEVDISKRNSKIIRSYYLK